MSQIKLNTLLFLLFVTSLLGQVKNIGLPEIDGVRIGRHVRLFVEAATQEAAEEKVEEACKKLLSNQIMESYAYSVTEA